MIILEVQGSVIVVVMRTVILRFLFLLAASRALGCEIEIKKWSCEVLLVWQRSNLERVRQDHLW